MKAQRTLCVNVGTTQHCLDDFIKKGKNSPNGKKTMIMSIMDAVILNTKLWFVEVPFTLLPKIPALRGAFLMVHSTLNS